MTVQIKEKKKEKKRKEKENSKEAKMSVRVPCGLRSILPVLRWGAREVAEGPAESPSGVHEGEKRSQCIGGIEDD